VLTPVKEGAMRRSIVRPVLSLGLALGLLSSLGPVVANAGQGGAPGVPIGPQGARYPDGTAKINAAVSPAAAAQAKDKAALRDLYIAQLTGKASSAAYHNGQQRFTSRWGIALQPTPTLTTSTVRTRTISPLCPLAAGGPMLPNTMDCTGNRAYNSVTLTQVAEQYCSFNHTYCYCGPATGVSMLRGLGYNTSHDGETLSQNELAINKYLETNYWGGTPWSGLSGDHPMPETLNYWRTGSYSGYYEADGLGMSIPAPDLSTYENDVRYDIDNGWSLAPDIHEKVNQYHLPGHPSGTEIWHWLPVYGYTSYGSYTSYADPATSVWSGVSATNSVSAANMDGILQDRGLVW
jgi:hypothetical protein